MLHTFLYLHFRTNKTFLQEHIVALQVALTNPPPVCSIYKTSPLLAERALDFMQSG